VPFGIEVNEVGKEIGFQNGDKIISVDGKQVENFMKIIPTIVLDGARTVQVERDGRIIDVEISDADLALLLKSKDVMTWRKPFDIQVGSLVDESPAAEAGLQKGDIFVSIDGKQFEFYDQFSDYLNSKKNETVTLTLLRDGNEITQKVNVSEEGKLGFYPVFNNPEIFQLATINYGLFESIPAGISRGVQTTKDYLKQFKLFFKPETKAYESLGGFATIGNIFPSTWDWFSFWNMTAFISIILAIMNLLPIPALDGGHVMFLAFEMISGRKPGEKFLEYAQIAGMVILLGLVLFANANDIIKMINGTF
jgi:regulator of sigma E protease